MSKASKLLRNPKNFIRDSELFQAATLAKKLLTDVKQALANGERATGPLSKTSRAAALDIAAALAEMQVARTEVFYDLSRAEERSRSTRELEEFFFSLLKATRPDSFLEIGAKDAYASLRARKTLTEAKVVAFEANPFTYERFVKKRGYEEQGVDYRNLALADKVGTVAFNVRKREDGKPHADGQGSILKHKTYAPGHLQVEVPCTTLDLAFEEIGCVSPAMWIDVEGATALVMAGGDRAFQNTSMAFIEVETKEYWGGQILRSGVIRELLGKGLYPVACDFQSQNQQNILFCSSPIMATPEFRKGFKDYRMRLRKGAADQELSSVEPYNELSQRLLGWASKRAAAFATE